MDREAWRSTVHGVAKTQILHRTQQRAWRHGVGHPKTPVDSRYSGHAEAPAGAGRVGGEESGVIFALLLPASALGLRQWLQLQAAPPGYQLYLGSNTASYPFRLRLVRPPGVAGLRVSPPPLVILFTLSPL